DVGAGTIAVTDSNGTTDISGNQVAVGGVNPVVISGDTGTIGGLTNRTFDPNNIVNGQAATEDQLGDVYDVANAGWNVSAEGSNATNVGVNSTTGNSVDLNNDDGNIVVSKEADSNDVTFDLAENLDLGEDGSVTTGNSVLDTDGLTVAGVSPNDPNTQVGAGRIEVSGPGGAGGNTIVIDGATGTVGGLTNRTFDPNNIVNGQAATED